MWTYTNFDLLYVQFRFILLQLEKSPLILTLPVFLKFPLKKAI